MQKNALKALASLAFCALTAIAGPCSAQTRPWPNDPPASGGPSSPWPSNPPRAGGSFGGAPAAPAPGLMEAAPMPGPMGAGPMTPVPPQAGRPGGGAPPCMDEFTKLQAETDKRAKTAREAGKRKAPREEMCKHLQAFESAIGKWAKYVKDNASSCGIPEKIGQQLKVGHDNIAKTAKQVCAAAVGGSPGQAPTPTLSDALGTTRMPSLDTTRPSASTGTLNTLTGSPLGR